MDEKKFQIDIVVSSSKEALTGFNLTDLEPPRQTTGPQLGRICAHCHYAHRLGPESWIDYKDGVNGLAIKAMETGWHLWSAFKTAVGIQARQCLSANQGFHTTPSSAAKRHPKQIKKDNIAKKLAKKEAYEASKPSPIVSRPTRFFASLHTPVTAYTSTGHENLSNFITQQESKLVFEQAPPAIVEATGSAAVHNKDHALSIEQKKAEMVQKIVGLQNANAHAVQRWNIERAIDWFGRQEGDTGSAEVQAAILTIRIQNLYSHLQIHRKDKHNYKQLRTMVHQRAKILKYLKSKSLERYYTCLRELGLEPRAVEGEIIV
ncbi:hypothetical protein BZG36_03240 [Bifiguratus adelaidae]|uniref:30S ribosomal protein S15 n=1 Tax=Bifiguratus adelaidae TaxID=1938954 RepID=A0A261Y014_9FUNG|nr:hypothetical protein BZG36_03240 [Bifiguratus adelaidae]